MRHQLVKENNPYYDNQGGEERKTRSGDLTKMTPFTRDQMQKLLKCSISPSVHDPVSLWGTLCRQFDKKEKVSESFFSPPSFLSPRCVQQVWPTKIMNRVRRSGKKFQRFQFEI